MTHKHQNKQNILTIYMMATYNFVLLYVQTGECGVCLLGWR